MNKLNHLVIPFFLTSLLFGCGSDSSDDNPSGDTVVDMGVLDPGQNNITLSDEFGPDHDFVLRYRFQAEADISYSIDITSEESSVQRVVVELQAPDCSESSSSPGQQVVAPIRLKSFEFTSTTDCEVNLDVSQSGFLNPGDFFRLGFNIIIGTDDGLMHDTFSHEPNNTFNSAFKIESGTRYDTSTSLKDDEDFFVIEALAGQTLNILIPAHPSPTTNALLVQVFDRDRNPLTNATSQISSNGTTLDKNVELNTDGTVFIKAFDRVEGGQRSYSLTATLSE